MPEFLSTRDLPERHQFEAWRSWLEGLFDVDDPAHDYTAGFCATHSLWTIAGLTVALATVPSSRVSRPAVLIRRNPIDHWVLSLGHKDTHVRAGSADHLVRSQVPFLSSLAHSYSADRPADQRLHLYLPRDEFRSLALLDTSSGLVLDTSLGRLLANFLSGVASRLPALSEAELPYASEAMRVMVNACIAPSADRLSEAAQHLDATRLQRVTRVVRRHLTSAELDAGMLCRAAGMSRTSLYRLFKGEGGVMSFIQRERLLACRRSLEDPANQAPIHRIASTFGFEDPSAFSRLFQREFGCTPSEIRWAAQSDVALAERRSPAMGYSRRNLRDHLCRL
jgi:AraC-like DNA-binding protein